MSEGGDCEDPDIEGEGGGLVIIKQYKTGWQSFLAREVSAW